MSKNRGKPAPPKPPAPTSLPRQRFADGWIYAVLFLATLAVYAQVRHLDFLNFDDPDYVVNNPHVRAGVTSDSLRWALVSGEAANWFPVTRLSHLFDVQWFGLDSGWHHLVNVVIHGLAVLLLFAFLRRSTGTRWPSAWVALVFALHPLHVESVAWIAERKDVLGAFFWFLSLWAYVRYVERPGAGRYLAVLAAFCLGLMAKPMIVTLPFVLLLLDVWPLGRRRTGALLREKVPFLLLAAAASVVTYMVQGSSGAVQSAGRFPLGLRVANALVTYVIYMAKTVWPARLAVFYPYPSSLPFWQGAAAGLALAAITVLVLRSFPRRPYLAVGWLWYVGTLVPVIGLVQVGAQARADRYMYVPMVGLLIMVAWSAARWLEPRPALAAGLAALSCFALAAAAWLQLSYWESSERLFRHALDVTAGNYLAEHNLGVALLDDPSRLPEATAHLQASLRIHPDSARAHTDLGNALAKRPELLAEAVAEYQAALRLDPEEPIPHNDLGATLARLGRLPEAIREYQIALRLQPDYAAARQNLALAQASLASRLSDTPAGEAQAVGLYQDSLRNWPDSAEPHYNLALLLLKRGQTAEAIAHFESAIRIRPDYAEAHNNLGVALSSIPGRLPDAIGHFQAALRIAPDYVDARANLDLARRQAAPGR